MTRCPECERLNRAREAAHATGDRSRETDHVVLLRRHTASAHPLTCPAERTPPS